MEKYNSEKPTLKKRTEKNKNLYAHIYDDATMDEYSLNSNMTVLNTDSKVIDVNQIRNLLDRKYRGENVRKPIVLPKEKEEEIKMANTKEYDINSILEKARKEKSFDYEKERLKSIHNTQYEILKKLDIKDKEANLNMSDEPQSSKKEDEENLVNLINTITALELKNKNNQKKNEALDLLSDLKDDDEDTSEEETKTEKEIQIDDDYDDFAELKDDIKSNSILIKIVSILFVLILLLGCLILANNYFDLGLF